jgi:hypothetical protein
MSRYDYIKVFDSLLPVNGLQKLDLSNLEFQTKDLDREFLLYHITESGELLYDDYEYELVEQEDSFFRFKMRKVMKGTVISNYTGDVIFYGKPYETFYKFKAKFTDGKLQSIERLL